MNKKIRCLPFLLGLCTLFFIVLIISTFMHKSPLKGKWNMDDVTVYEFDSGNKGALLLPSAEYKFTYTVKEDMLYIDFASQEAKDAQYTFQIKDDTLTLEGGNATVKGTYTLRKVK